VGSTSQRRWREWYPALEAVGVAKRGPYHLRYTFAAEALAAGVSVFELPRLMGTSAAMIDRTYGHLARDSEESIRARLDARSARVGVGWRQTQATAAATQVKADGFQAFL
jgi:integrase